MTESELEGLAELAVRLIGVLSTLDLGEEETKNLKGISFWIFSGVLESTGQLGAGSGTKRHGKAMTWHGGLSALGIMA